MSEQSTEKHPSLAGKKILITRAENQLESTAAEILKRGGVPLHLPCLEVECLDQNIRQSIPLLENGPIELLFTSRNSVQCLASLTGEKFSKLLKPHKVTAIGTKTAEALKQLGVSPDMLPETASQEGLIDAYRDSGIPKELIFFRAEEGSDSLSNALTKQGCEIITIHTYRMKCPTSDASEMVHQIEQQNVDAVLLGSPKTVKNYIKRLGNRETANIPAIAVISPQVSSAATDLGLNVQATAKKASFDAMLDALADYFEHNFNNSGA
ncbi:MAG: uroporphyrinogen-III synthase [Mariprofundaceae bacterium]